MLLLPIRVSLQIRPVYFRGAESLSQLSPTFIEGLSTNLAIPISVVNTDLVALGTAADIHPAVVSSVESVATEGAATTWLSQSRCYKITLPSLRSGNRVSCFSRDGFKWKWKL
ncbi:uncharacterized protein [Rutidosis leptorrhynchoides]|uniref:uncharacterized protein n=1 Tax=Rutidosis leptorrhynchoides TaxID=125765 RepID=UPI003A99276A